MSQYDVCGEWEQVSSIRGSCSNVRDAESRHFVTDEILARDKAPVRLSGQCAYGISCRRRSQKVIRMSKMTISPGLAEVRALRLPHHRRFRGL